MSGVTRGTTVLFDHPIDVELARHPRPFRVKGVIRDKNPNGLPGLFSYAIAEWQMPGSGNWLPVRDLVQQMRLANTVEHDLGQNTEDYANVDGDRVIGVTEYDFRIVFYTPSGKTVHRYPVSPEKDSIAELSVVLDGLLADGHATGGDLEMFVDGFGWCVNNEEAELFSDDPPGHGEVCVVNELGERCGNCDHIVKSTHAAVRRSGQLYCSSCCADAAKEAIS